MTVLNDENLAETPTPEDPDSEQKILTVKPDLEAKIPVDTPTTESTENITAETPAERNSDPEQKIPTVKSTVKPAVKDTVTEPKIPVELPATDNTDPLMKMPHESVDEIDVREEMDYQKRFLGVSMIIMFFNFFIR